MMDKKPHIKPYLYGMLAGFGAIALSIIFFFLIYRFQGFGNAISKVTGILMPFIYGAVIAYLLKPVCNTVENFLRRLLPEKMGSTANMLAVAARYQRDHAVLHRAEQHPGLCGLGLQAGDHRQQRTAAGLH